MASYDAETAAALAADPNTPAQTLADIAAGHPALLSQLRHHPNAYPGLVQWIDQVQAAAAQTTTVQETYAYTEQPVPSQPLQPGYAAPQGFPGTQPYAAAGASQPGKRRTGLFVGLAAAVVVVLAGIGIAVPLALGGLGGGSSPVDGLRLMEAPDGEFSLNIFDAKRFEAATGEPFPESGSESDIENWLDLMYEEHEDRVAIDTLGNPFGLGSLVFASGGQIHLNDREGEASASAFLGEIPQSRLDQAFGEARRGVWEAETYEGPAFLTRIDGSVYFSWYEDELPESRPEADRSLAADRSVVRVLTELQKSEAYSYTIERDDYPAGNVEGITGEAPDHILSYGSALSVRDGSPLLTLAYDFGNPEAAEANLALMEEAFRGSAAGLGQKQPRVSVSGSLVVAECEITGGDLSSTAFDLRNVYDW